MGAVEAASRADWAGSAASPSSPIRPKVTPTVDQKRCRPLCAAMVALSSTGNPPPPFMAGDLGSHLPRNARCWGFGVSFPRIAFAACLSWFVGFVVIGLLGGLGVRESVFVELAGSLDPGVAAAVALVSRMVFVVVDVAGAGSGNPQPRVDLTTNRDIVHPALFVADSR